MVNVLEIDGQRARIDSPVKGWVTIQLRSGYVLLERVTMINFEHLEPVDDIRVNQSDHKKFIKDLNENKYDSETLLDDLIDDEEDPCNEFKDSNVFPMLKHSRFLTKIVKKHLGGKRNDDDKLPSFVFGEMRIYFWKHWKGQVIATTIWPNTPISKTSVSITKYIQSLSTAS